MNKRELILITIQDSVTDLLYYDRKEDEELFVGDIDELVKNGDITIEEMVAEFDKYLRSGLGIK